MRTDTRTKIAQLIRRSGLLAALERWEATQPNVLRILAYHRVDYPEAGAGRFDPSLLSATPEAFARQMRFVREQYTPITLEALLAALEGDRSLPSRAVMVTFDDGYRDFSEHVWPVLEEEQVPAILFVPTGFLDGNDRLFWWDRLYRAFTHTERTTLTLPAIGTWSLEDAHQRYQAFEAVKQIVVNTDHHRAMMLVEEALETLDVTPYTRRALLTWDEVRRMSAAGLYVGAHTRSHPFLSRVSPDDARAEVLGSQQDIEREIGHTWPVFAYPRGHPGDFDPGVYGSLDEAGIRVAVTMIEGHNLLGRSPALQLRRLGMSARLSMTEFRLALTGIYNLYGALQRMRATQTRNANARVPAAKEATNAHIET